MLSAAPTRVALIWPDGLDPRRVLPLPFAWLASNTAPELCEFRLFDLALGRPAPEDLERELASFRPEVVGISSFASNFPRALEAARAAKRAVPSAAVVAGGQYASAWPEGVLSHPEFDFVIKGEGEPALTAFLKELRSGARRWELVPGLVRMAGGVLADAAPAIVEDLDSLTPPDYKFIALDEYLRRGYRVWCDPVPNAPIQTTRGCPYSCAFCTGPYVSGRRLRRFSTAYVMRWIKELHRDFGVTWFNIIDDNFTFSPDGAKEFCRAAPRLEIPGLRFGTPNGVRAQHGDPELWKLMRSAGWEQVVVAPESGSARVLELMKKELPPALMEKAVADIRAAGLPVCGFFIVGYPGETRADLALTMRLVSSFDLAEIFVFQPLPGSPIFRELLAAGEITPDFVPGVDDFSSGERSYVSRELRGVNFYWLIFRARLGLALRHPLRTLRHLKHLDPAVAFSRVCRQASDLARFALGRRVKDR
jgi:anaerobic magnesium-protoporphyrin IX monomethyl ester cyclase